MTLLQPNTLVAGRFRLVREIGRGGMGAVWLAQHAELDVECAVKFMEVASSGQARERFSREAKAAARLRGSHVVQVFDHGIWEGIPFIVMELLQGEDLRKRLERGGRLLPSECYRVVLQVAKALGKAHALGIIHRDLKPDNIFMSDDGGHEVVKVLDFGIAKILGDQKVAGVETKTGTLLGTPYYMSPEQLQGTKAIDHRSDLWSLAVVIYECLVGEKPFLSDGMGDLVMQIMGFPLPVPSSKAPDLPAGFDSWWLKAAARDPNERYQDVNEMVLALAAALGEEASSGDLLPRSSDSGARRLGAWKTADVLGETAEAPGDSLPAPSLSGGNLTKSLIAEPRPTAARWWPLSVGALVAAGLFAGLAARGTPAPAREPVSSASPPVAASTETTAAAAPSPTPPPTPPPAASAEAEAAPPAASARGPEKNAAKSIEKVKRAGAAPRGAPTPGKPDMGF